MFDNIFYAYRPIKYSSDNTETPIYTIDYNTEEDFLNYFPIRKFGESPKQEVKQEDNGYRNWSTPINTSPNKPTNTAQKIVANARKYLGNPYVWGGKSPKTGFDCSGLLGYVYKQAGYNIGMSTTDQFKAGKEVSLKDAKVGDIICTPGTGASGKHVKMISKIENGQIYTIEAKGKKYGIVETPLTKTNNIITIRRII